MSTFLPGDLASRSILRLDRHDPYLRLYFVTIFVRDQDLSLRFYVDQLGFTLHADHRLENGDRWVAVAPPDGTAMLALMAPAPNSPAQSLIGKSVQVVLITDDVQAEYEDWSRRGVRFRDAPQRPLWGGMVTNFEDPDGNSLALVGVDEVSRQIDEHRRALAERLESERRAAQEMEIAKQVQARLFPQKLPVAATLDYAGVCIQARQVGGDYYDFLELGGERLALVIGDIAGKGIAGALLMANLQASLRSQCAIALDQMQRLLRSANQLFYENTSDNAYATLFFAEYDDNVQRLRYANCGHLPGLLLRSDGALEHLDSTGTVLGLFKEWDCFVEERQLFPGDVFVLYTDGVTESFDASEEEFGEERLVETLRRNRELSADALAASIVSDVQQFSQREQHDDITLIVATCGGN